MMTMFNDSAEATQAYLTYIKRHYVLVNRVWLVVKDKLRLKANVAKQLEQEVLTHDLSKLSAEEFIPYRKKFYPAKHEDPSANADAFAEAWDHHIVHNPHHWLAHLERGVYLDDRHCIHMVIDWIAMGITGKLSVRQYFDKVKANVTIPKKQLKLIDKIIQLYC